MVNENGGRKTIPKFEAFVKQLALEVASLPAPE